MSETGLEIAVIGMSGRFPGASNLDKFWENLKNGVESLSFFTEDELLSAGAELSQLRDPNYVKAGGGRLQDPDDFDALFFDYTPNEAVVMHPQLRFFHECAWEALENAGYNPDSYEEKIGLYAGASSGSGWESLTILSGKADRVGRFVSASLSNKDSLSTRVSYKLNLKGPTLVVHSACSTSLAAVDLACRGIWTGQCNMALAGGVSIKGADGTGYIYKEGMIRPPDGHCRAFDAKAKGTVSGDGIGVVVLKLLEDARSDGDTILAVVKGSAVNNDGSRKVGYTAPSVEGQAEAIRAAHLMAEIPPETITYVETHGTGTPLGDPVEIEALKQGFGTGKIGFCALGTLKPNIGHLDAAAGIAGFIKAVLVLKNHRIPPCLHFETPNPAIDFKNSPFYVNTTLTPWKNQTHPLRAGVSSFGIGGTNAHVVLEEGPAPPALKGPPPPAVKGVEEHNLIVLSAKTLSALDTMTENLANYLKENPKNLGDAAYTLQVGRKMFAHRRMLVCSNVDDAVGALGAPESRGVYTTVSRRESPPVIFVFPGLGAQYVDMGRELYQKVPPFREEMDRCFEILNSITGYDTKYDIKRILYPDDTHPATNPGNINQPEIAQPLLFIFEYALAQLLIKWGILPHRMIGYSFGEYTAACVAGVFSPRDALKLIVARGRLMNKLPRGVLLSVPLPKEELSHHLPGELSLAIDNGPSCIVGGAEEAVAAFEKGMKNRRILTMRVPNSHAVHTHMMTPMLKEFEQTFRQITLDKPRIPYISNVTGDQVKEKDAVDPAYWAAHLDRTVRFAEGIEKLTAIPNAIFIEVGPGRDIAPLVMRHAETNGGGPSPLQMVSLVRHPERNIPDLYYLLNKIGQLWLHGKGPDWRAFHGGAQRFRIPLPTYPFERLRFSIDPSGLTLDPAALMKSSPGKDKESLADWFYFPYWKRSVPVDSHASLKPGKNESNCWLVFLDRCGLGEDLKKRLETLGQNVVTVTAGDGFDDSRRDRYTVNPRQPEDYRRLFSTLRSMKKNPHRILHLWSLTGTGGQPIESMDETLFEETQALGFYSLLEIAKAAGKTDPGSSPYFYLNVISDQLFDVGGEEALDPGKSTMLGPLAVIPQEHPTIRCRVIDILCPGPGGPGSRQGVLVDQIIGETFGTFGPGWEPAAAFRGPHRLVRRFEPLHLEAATTEQLPLRKGGVYLITGGLGKIGMMLARYLAGRYNARLILVGRTPLPSPEQGEGKEEEIKKIGELESLGAEVVYFQGDVSDGERMQSIAAEAGHLWGRIHGVIHAAGIVGGPGFNIVDLLKHSDCRRHFRAKVYGTIVLESVFRDKPLDFCWCMSSVSSVLGGLQFAAYAGANAYIDTFVARLKRRGRVPWISVDWDGMPQPETEDAFTRILAVLHTGRVVVSRNGNLQERINQWIKLETPGEANASSTGEDTPLHPRPQLLTPYAAPSNDVQRSIVGTWEKIFGFRQIGIRDDFLELGGDSLKAITVISAIHKQLKVEIPLPVFFSNTTVEKLAGYIEETGPGAYTGIPPVEKKEYYPLSSAQKRLYFLQQLDLNGTGYNMPLFYPLGKEIDIHRLESVLKKLIHRHESLRTSFFVVNDEPVQRIHQDVEFSVQRVTVDDYQNFVRPFDLRRAPLIRSGLIKLPGGGHTWLLDTHHIVSDGTSHTILSEDFSALYKGTELGPLSLRYKDFAQWQNRSIADGKIKAQEAYWLDVLSGELPRLNMATDHKRPGVFTFAGGRYGFTLEPEAAAGLKAAGVSAGGTLYMNILAALNTLFYKYTGQSDIIIGTGIAGRHHADLQRVVGMFVNSLPMRNRPEGPKTYRAFLKEVIDNSVGAFENQDVPFETLVDLLDSDRDPSRNPLFDISMVVQNFRRARESGKAEKNPGQAEILPTIDDTLPIVEYKNPTSKFDMTIFVREAEEDVHFSIEYYTGIFKPSTVERFVSHLRNVIKIVGRDPAAPLKDIDIITHEERRRVLYEFNDTHREFPTGKTIHGLFEERAGASPDSAALVHEDHMITYGELNRKANQLARYLYNKKGIRPGDRIGIFLSQSLDRIISIFGTLKSGGCYVPLEPSLPLERLKYMIDDADIGIVLSGKRTIRDLNRLQWECKGLHSYLCLDSPDIQNEEEQEENELMDGELWHHVAESAHDDITGGGWVSSYTGEPFSRREMDEYGDNILKKLKPLLHSRMRVLEIGCASGISMFRIAPNVGLYYGTDLSSAIIDKNREIAASRGHKNITLAALAAHEIDGIREKEEKDFDLIVMNSVIQCFHGHNYLRKVIRKALRLLGDSGYLFIGDVMDLDKKNALLEDLTAFKRSHRDKGYNTKTDFSSELFLSREFWQDLEAGSDGIHIRFSDKIRTVENELTKFRYDLLIEVNKSLQRKNDYPRRKYREDAGAVMNQGVSALNMDIRPTGPAYIIYTSGTTGRPKGVVLPHRGNLNLNTAAAVDFKVDQWDHIIQFANISFDASVFEITLALLNGAVLHLPGAAVINDYNVFLDYLAAHNITLMILPPPYANHLEVERLHSLRLLITGGSPPDTHFTAKIRGRFEYVNAYGPTEDSICCSYWILGNRDVPDRIPIGKPLNNTRFYILDKYKLPRPPGVPGELYISGAGLAAGYLNNPELTNSKFQPPGGGTPGPSTPLYRTGDSARWLPDGNVEFLGRVDEQVKIRGFRIEPGEIEQRLTTHDAVKNAVVIDREDQNGEKYLAAYIVSDSTGVTQETLEPRELKEYLSRSLPDYMVPSYFIPVEEIPLTPSGKIDRKGLPGPGFLAGKDYAAPTNEIERNLAALWSEILGVEKNVIGITDNFFDLGGHSLKATVLISRIHKTFEVNVPLVEIFRLQTIRDLARFIEQSGKVTFFDIEPVEKRDYYELTFNQKRLWFIQHMNPESTAFNIPGILTLDTGLDPDLAEECLRRVLDVHESLRTGFLDNGGFPFQFIKESVDVPLKVVDISHLPVEEINRKRKEIRETDLRTPFDLSTPPLFRAVLVKWAKNGETGWDFITNIHHIVSDGWSQDILIQDFQAVYKSLVSGEPVKEELAPRYKDFAAWQNRRIDEPGFKEESHRFWMKKMGNGVPVIMLPTDFETGTGRYERDRSGTGFRVMVDGEFKDRLEKTARQHNTTLFTVMFSTFLLLFSDFSRQEEIACSIIEAGRDHASLNRVIGFFVNSLLFKTHVAGGEHFSDFLGHINREILDTFLYKSYPLEPVLDELNMKYPEVPIAFNMLNIGTGSGKTALESFEPRPVPNAGEIKFDMEVYVSEYSNGLEMLWVCRKSLFAPQTAAFIASEYIRLMDFFSKNTGMGLNDYHREGKKRRFKRRK